MNKQNIFLGFLVACLVAAMAFVGTLQTNAAPGAAPALAVTPVTFSNNSSRAQGGSRIVTFFDGTPAAYLTPVSSCYNLQDYNTLDLVYTAASVASMTIDQTYGNNSDGTKQALGASIIAANATPVNTPVAVQVPNFNAYTCVKVTSADATPVGVYVKALAK